MQEWRERDITTAAAGTQAPKFRTGSRVPKFASDHFRGGLYDREARLKLQQHCVGLPIFSPDPGCEWGDEWACHVVEELASIPSLVDDILKGRIEFRGQPLTELAPFKVTPYAGAVTKEHLFEDVEDAIKSYECCWLRSADFPDKKPSWAWITDEQYDKLKNVMYAKPTLGRGYLLEDWVDEDDDEGPEEGFYNSKHHTLHNYMLQLND